MIIFNNDKEELLKEKPYSLGVEHGIEKKIVVVKNMIVSGMTTKEIY